MGSCYIDDVIRIALGEVGYEEGPNNWTKYAADLDSIHYFNGNKQNVAWCGTFDYWCILMACIPADRSLADKKWDGLYFTYQPGSDNCACACRYGAQYFRNAGAFYSSPKVGDIAFFGSAGSETHQGIVYTVNGSSFQSIEGNHNDRVAIVNRSVSECSGFGRPRYDEGPSPEPPTPTPTDKYTVKTNSGDALRLREEPNTWSAQIGWINNGTTFTSSEVVEGESIGGVATWVYYNGGYASGKYLVPTPVAPNIGPAPEPTPDKQGYSGEFPTLPSRGYFQKGDTGEEVKKLQSFLEWLIPGCLSKYGVDGEVGYETLGAVKEAQAILGVKVDGFYGPQTDAAAKAYKK